MSVALRNKPARFTASLFSLPAGIKRAASRASVALASQSSSVSGEGWLVWFNGPCPSENHVDNRHAIIRRLRVSARHPTFECAAQRSRKSHRAFALCGLRAGVQKSIAYECTSPRCLQACTEEPTGRIKKCCSNPRNRTDVAARTQI